MADLIDIHSASQRHILGDDTNATLKLTNTNSDLSGKGLEANGIEITTSADRIPAANATIVGLHIAGPSRASGAVLALGSDALVSVGSIDFGAGADWTNNGGLGAVRVVRSDGTFGWIPVLNDDALEDVSVPA